MTNETNTTTDTEVQADANIHLISFTNTDLFIEQEIVIGKDGGNIDQIISGLNSGELVSTLDHDAGREEEWIRDTQGNGVAVILNQKVTVTGAGFKDYTLDVK